MMAAASSLRRSPEAGFQPWVGESYGPASRWGLSVMVLGESHYDERGNSDWGSGLTTRVINDVVNGYHWPTTRLIGQTFMGNDYNAAAFWQSVAFYNYVQELLPGSQARPRMQQLRDGWVPLQEVTRRLAPDVIVAFGYGMWDVLVEHLPDQHSLGISLPGGRGVEKRQDVSYTRLGDALICGFRHPARQYAWRDWKPIVEALMTRARQHSARTPGTA